MSEANFDSGAFLPSVKASNQVISREWLVLVVAVCIIMITEYVGLLKPIRSVTEKIWSWVAVPTASLTYAAVDPFTTWRAQRQALNQLDQLQLQYSQVQATITQLQALKTENDNLRSLISSGSGTVKVRAITTPIIAYGQPMIAAGTDQNLFEGEPILVGQTMVGIVNQVSDHQSSVLLVSQENGPKVLARTESGVSGILMGDGKQVLLTEIPIDSKLTPGEKVVTQGQTGIRPALLIGTISQVKAEPQASVQTAVVEQMVSFYESTMVVVE